MTNVPLCSRPIAHLGLIPRLHGTLNQAAELEQRPHAFFHGWGRALLLNLTFLAVACVYVQRLYLTSECCFLQKEDWPLYLLNKALAVAAAWSFSFVFFVGGVAAVLKKPLGAQILRFLHIRKQTALIAFGGVILHAIISGILIGSEYYGRWLDPDRFGKKFLLQYSVGLLFGCCAFAVFGVLSVASVRAVGAGLSWREWSFLMSCVGMVGLSLVAGHAFAIGWDTKGEGYFRKKFDYLPTLTFVTAWPAACVVAFRLVLWTLGSWSRCTRLRSKRLVAPTAVRGLDA